MNKTTIKNELQNILSGKSEISYGESIQTIARYLRESRGTSEENKGNESSKSEETKKLMDYTEVKVVFGFLLLVSIASIFRWRVGMINYSILTPHLKMEAIETLNWESENHFHFSIHQHLT